MTISQEEFRPTYEAVTAQYAAGPGRPRGAKVQEMLGIEHAEHASKRLARWSVGEAQRLAERRELPADVVERQFPLLVALVAVERGIELGIAAERARMIAQEVPS